MQTIIKKESPLIVQFQEAGATISANILMDYVVSNWTHADVIFILGEGEDESINANPEVVEGEERATPVLLDVDVPQLISTNNFHYLRKMHPELFVPSVEDVVVPRYKRVFSAEAFARDVIGWANWVKVEQAALTDPAIGAWRNLTLSGIVDMDHVDYINGMALAVSKGIFTEEEANAFNIGLLVE